MSIKRPEHSQADSLEVTSDKEGVDQTRRNIGIVLGGGVIAGGLFGIAALLKGASPSSNQTRPSPILAKDEEEVSNDSKAKLILPENIPKAPEYNFTGEPIELGVPEGLSLPPDVKFEEVARQIVEKINEEVLVFRSELESGKFRDPSRMVARFVGWLNEQIAKIFTGETQASIKEEYEFYFGKYGQKYHEYWEYRLNQYLLPQGKYLVTNLRPRPLVQLFDIDQDKSQWVEAKMGGKNYRAPLLIASLGPEYSQDDPVSGFTRAGGPFPVTVVVDSVLRLDNDEKRKKFEALLPMINEGRVDKGRFYEELAKDTKEAAVRSVSQHEIGHYIMFRDFPKLGNELRRYPFMLEWQGSKLNRLTLNAQPGGPEEEFTKGVQIATSERPWRQLIGLVLNDYFKRPQGKLLALISLIAASESEYKNELIARIEYQGLAQAMEDEGFHLALKELLLSGGYTDEHSRKAGELYMQLNYNYFLQNSQ